MDDDQAKSSHLRPNFSVYPISFVSATATIDPFATSSEFPEHTEKLGIPEDTELVRTNNNTGTQT